jgi:hypothetical protein
MPGTILIGEKLRQLPSVIKYDISDYISKKIKENAPYLWGMGRGRIGVGLSSYWPEDLPHY